MSKAKHLLHRLNYVVQNAKKKIPLYRMLYEAVGTIESLDEFNRLPILTDTILGSERLENTLAGLDQTCITRTFGDECCGIGHLPKLLNYDDALDEYKVLAFIAEFASLQEVQRVMLLADEKHIYTISEFGKYLAYYEWPLVVFIIRKRSADELANHLIRFKPTIVFVDAKEVLPSEIFPTSVKYLFTFNQPNIYLERGSAQSFQWFDIFRDPRIGLAAIKEEESTYYRYDPRFFYFQATANKRLVVTSFINRLQPVIRYQLPSHGTASDLNQFVVSE